MEAGGEGEEAAGAVVGHGDAAHVHRVQRHQAAHPTQGRKLSTIAVKNSWNNLSEIV